MDFLVLVWGRVMAGHRINLAVLGLMLLSGTSAWAQVVSEKAPIAPPIDRPPHLDDVDRISFEPVGARFGVFTLLPRLETAVTYNDNIYALEAKTDDVVFRISPSFRLTGKADPYTINVTAAVDRLEFKDNHSESRTDWTIGLDNKYELSAGTFVSAYGRYRQDHEDRGDPNALTTNLRPTLYKNGEFGAEVSRDVARLGMALTGTYSDFNYYNAAQIGGGITNNNDRDRAEYTIASRVSYEFSPGYSILTRFAYADVNYSDPLDDSGFSRDSKSYRASAGIKLEFTQLLVGEVTAGYLWRNYSDPRFKTFKRAAYNAALTWYPTELTSVRVSADRQGQETVVAGYAGYFANTFTFRAEHELMRTLKINVGGRYIINNYLRSGIVAVPRRQEKYYTASGGLKYAFSRNLSAGLGYEWTKKSSLAITPGSAFNRNRLSANINIQL